MSEQNTVTFIQKAGYIWTKQELGHKGTEDGMPMEQRGQEGKSSEDLGSRILTLCPQGLSDG